MLLIYDVIVFNEKQLLYLSEVREQTHIWEV